MTIPRMHADEIDTDAELVRRLLAAQFPQRAELPIRRVASAGTDNALYRLGGDMVARLPRIHWAVANVAHEYCWLPWLAARLPVAVPSPLAMGTPAAGYPYPWSVYSWLEGDTPVVGRLADPRRLALELAGFVTALQRLDPIDGPASGVSLAMQDLRVREWIAASRGLVDTDAVTRVWDAALRVPEWDGPPVWVHGDLAPGNVLLVDGQVSAVIDWGSVGVGDPSIDLRVAWNLLPRNLRGVLRDALHVDDATWARGRARALAQALGQLPYYQHTNPTLAASAQYVIGEVMADDQRHA